MDWEINFDLGSITTSFEVVIKIRKGEYPYPRISIRWVWYDYLHTLSISCVAGRALKGRPVGGGGSVVSNKAGGMYIGLAGIGKALPQPSFISNAMTSFPVTNPKTKQKTNINHLSSMKKFNVTNHLISS